MYRTLLVFENLYWSPSYLILSRICTLLKGFFLGHYFSFSLHLYQFIAVFKCVIEIWWQYLSLLCALIPSMKFTHGRLDIEPYLLHSLLLISHSQIGLLNLLHYNSVNSSHLRCICIWKTEYSPQHDSNAVNRGHFTGWDFNTGLRRWPCSSNSFDPTELLNYSTSEKTVTYRIYIMILVATSTLESPIPTPSFPTTPPSSLTV